MKRNLIAALPPRSALALALPAQAANIIDEWASVKAPAAPALKPVTVDPKTTALLMLDFMNQNCGKRPRLPRLDSGDEEAARRGARRQGAWWSIQLIANTTPADVIKDVAPLADEPHVLSGPDKFLHTDLEKILQGQRHQDRDRGRHLVERRGALHGEPARRSAA